MANKKNKRILAILLIALLFIGIVYYTFPKEEAVIENQGVAIQPVIVDANGNILDSLGIVKFGADFKEPLTIIAGESGTGFNVVDNTATFLAFLTKLDNSGGDSEVTITDLLGDNPCNSANPKISDPECTGITNIMDGAINVWSDNGFFPRVLSIGEQSTETIGGTPNFVQSYNLDLSQIESARGLIDFEIQATGTFLDELGVPQTLPSTAGGIVTLKITPESCTDGTITDTNSGDADSNVFCSSTSVGDYCRASAFGVPELTERASLCGCCTAGNPADVSCGLMPDGEVCTTIGDCRTTWGADTCNPDGGILYCNSDGTITNECVICDGDGVDDTFGTADDNCPQNANGDYADSCIADTNFLCNYPVPIGTGFGVSISAPSISPITQCGDGVIQLANNEDCDTNDMGGETCISQGYSSGTLTCDMVGTTPGTDMCIYDTSGCASAFVEFRTSSVAYPSSGAIAYSNACTSSPLDRYGYEAAGIKNGELCDVRTDFQQPALLTGLPGTFASSPSGQPKLYADISNPNELWVCQDRVDGNSQHRRYDSTDGDSINVEFSSDSIDSGREVAC